MVSKRQKTAGKRKKRNSKKTRRFRQRGGVFEEQKPGESYQNFVVRYFKEDAVIDRIFRLIDMAKLNLLRNYKKKFWPEQMEKALEKAENLIDFFKKVKENLDGGDIEHRKVLIRIDSYSEEQVSIAVNELERNPDRRITLAIEAINYVEKGKDIKEKLAGEIINKLADDTGKAELKKIFNGDNILKLCELDQKIRNAFIDKGLVKNGKFYGYSIVDSPKA